MKLSGLAEALRKHGLTVVETPGWKSRAYAGRDLIDIRGVLWHHTVASEWGLANNDAPSLNVCINGRPGLPGPLCQIVFGRSGTVYLTAAGLANHAGAGHVPGIPVNMGNYYLIGVEMESTGVPPWDWTDDQIRVAPYLGAALETEYLSHLPPAQRLQIGHKAYAPGKIDPAGWPGDMAGLRNQINDILNGNGAVAPAANDKQKLEWSDMATEKEIRNVIRDELRRFVGDVVDVPGNQPTGKGNDQWTIPNAITSVWGDVGAIRKAVANLPDAILDAPVKLEGSTSGTTTLRKKIAWQAHEFHRNTEAVEALTDALDEPEGHPDEPYGA